MCSWRLSSRLTDRRGYALIEILVVGAIAAGLYLLAAASMGGATGRHAVNLTARRMADDLVWIQQRAPTEGVLWQLALIPGQSQYGLYRSSSCDLSGLSASPVLVRDIPADVSISMAPGTAVIAYNCQGRRFGTNPGPVNITITAKGHQRVVSVYSVAGAVIN